MHLGLDLICFQAKKYNKENPIRSPKIREFMSSMDAKGLTKGILITTSTFTADAKNTMSRIGKNIILIDGMELANLMFEHDIGVSIVTEYKIKDIDLDYFN